MYIRSSAAMNLHKRDNQGFDIAPSLIIFLVILGAGFMVCCGFAIFRFYGEDPDERNRDKRTLAQDAYMNQLRQRAREQLRRTAMRYTAGPSSRNMAHAPLSTG
jgi:hypothetical protein